MRNAIKRLIQLTLLFFLSIQLSYGGGILVGRTRVIYDANKKEASLPLSNKSENKPFLIQSWIDNGDGKTRGPFVVTPPLFRLNANDENNLRISYTGGELPQDKESIFYINVRAIPSTPKNDINELRLVIKTRIKLFYRPEKLQGKPYDAYKLLTFVRSGGQLLITNPSPYYVVFSYLTVGNTVLKDTDMIAPGGQLNVALPANNTGNTVEWSAINDYGGDTTPEKRTL
ncbi:fimbrial biogenesis chaperone [Rahnella contaminans]|jgi:P pilus assembly chaperone PapD|uniref:fimbrial biogenesis chaperone n=1 Tax=Rahnella contaminans TaxID=2703882 RepID=UPI001265ECA0|nr:molecular chaperone [Rahnella contaminans]KAB8305973.1 molecular chaperone [Rouxiella chamberiensis]MDF1896065.1 molecular chaperone [Rahnella contaminans]